MAATVQAVDRHRAYIVEDVQRLWFFPNGSDYLRYSPHFHLWYEGGFRQNFPLTHGFLIIYEGKLSIKSYWGNTNERIDVRDQLWFYRGTDRRAQWAYSMLIRGRPSHPDTVVPYQNVLRRIDE